MFQLPWFSFCNTVFEIRYNGAQSSRILMMNMYLKRQSDNLVSVWVLISMTMNRCHITKVTVVTAQRIIYLQTHNDHLQTEKIHYINHTQCWYTFWSYYGVCVCIYIYIYKYIYIFVLVNFQYICNFHNHTFCLQVNKLLIQKREFLKCTWLSALHMSGHKIKKWGGWITYIKTPMLIG